MGQTCLTVTAPCTALWCKVHMIMLQQMVSFTQPVKTAGVDAINVKDKALQTKVWSVKFYEIGSLIGRHYWGALRKGSSAFEA